MLSAKTLVRVAIGGLKSVAEFCKTHYLPLAVSLLALITFLMVPLPAALEPVSLKLPLLEKLTYLFHFVDEDIRE